MGELRIERTGWLIPDVPPYLDAPAELVRVSNGERYTILSGIEFDEMGETAVAGYLMHGGHPERR